MNFTLIFLFFYVKCWSVLQKYFFLSQNLSMLSGSRQKSIYFIVFTWVGFTNKEKPQGLYLLIFVRRDISRLFSQILVFSRIYSKWILLTLVILLSNSNFIILMFHSMLFTISISTHCNLTKNIDSSNFTMRFTFIFSSKWM